MRRREVAIFYRHAVGMRDEGRAVAGLGSLITKHFRVRGETAFSHPPSGILIEFRGGFVLYQGRSQMRFRREP